MKTYRKLLAIMGLALLLTVSLTGLASADVLHGAGELSAQGSGVANLRMTGDIEIKGHGVGLVSIRSAEEITATGYGRRVDRPDGLVILYGYRGKINISGTDMGVRMIGSKIEFNAQGEGTARLHGHGTYKTGKGRVGDWAPDGLDLALDQE